LNQKNPTDCLVKPKFLLFTDRASTPLLFKALAKTLHFSMDFGVFLESSAKKSQVFQKYSSKSPTVLFLDPTGTMKEEVYNGKIGYNDLKSFLEEKHRRWKIENDRQNKNKRKETQQDNRNLQLTQTTYQQICQETPLCLLIFTENTRSYQRDLLKQVPGIKDKMDNRSTKLGIVDCTLQEQFCNTLGITKSLLVNKIAAVFVKPKRKKITPVSLVPVENLLQEIETLADGLRLGETKLNDLPLNIHLSLS